jgi:hypothetical protein
MPHGVGAVIEFDGSMVGTPGVSQVSKLRTPRIGKFNANYSNSHFFVLYDVL